MKFLSDYLFWIGWGFLLISCVNRLDLDPSQFDQNLNQVVIEGFISDQPGPYVVKVFSSSNIDDVLNSRPGINAKMVAIFDDVGNKEVLQGERGFYYTTQNGIRGVVGRKYSVQVELLDGRIFESIPDELKPVGELDSIFVAFESNKPLQGPTEYSYNVFINATTSNTGSEFLRWRFTGIYYIETELDGCWSRIFENKPTVSDGKFIDGGRFKAVQVGSFPVNKVTFFSKFMVQIDQMSLTQASFDFFRNVRDQKDGAENLFQPGIGQLPTNIFEVNNNKAALGLFYATSVTSKQIFLTKGDVPVRFEPLQSFPEARCVNVYPNATYFRPPNWED